MENKIVELFDLILDINNDNDSRIKVYLNQNDRQISIIVYNKIKNKILKTLLITDLRNKNKGQQKEIKELCKFLVINSF